MNFLLICRENVFGLNFSMRSIGLSKKIFRYLGGLFVVYRWIVYIVINGSGSIFGFRSLVNSLFV